MDNTSPKPDEELIGPFTNVEDLIAALNEPSPEDAAPQINAAAAHGEVDETLVQIATNVRRALKHLQNGNHGWALDWLETADEALQMLTKANS